MRAVPLLLLLGGCLDTPRPPPVNVPRCDPGEDLDFDGWKCDGLAADCDDDDPLIHPGRLDVAGNDLDEDCDGYDTDVLDVIGGVSLDDSDGLAVVTPVATVRFAATGALLPESIMQRTAGVELLYQGDHPARELGVAVEPDFYTSTHSDGRGGRLVSREGPALVTVEIDWGGVADDPSATGVYGVSTFTFHPDGRIYRHDAIRASSDFPTGGDDYTLSRYESFVAGRFSEIDWSANPGSAIGLDNPGAGAIELFSAEADVGGGWICLDGSALVGLAWRGDTVAPRATLGPDSEPRVTLQLDLSRHQVTSQAHDAWTVLLLDPEGFFCAEMAAVASAYQHPAPITVTAPATIAPIDAADRDGDGFAEAYGVYRVEGGGAFTEIRFEAETGVPGVALATGVISEPGITVWQDDERLIQGVDYLIDALPVDLPGPGGNPPVPYTIWLAGGFEAGTVLRVAAPGAEPSGPP